ncbi:MAG: isoprenylcysteine carboxylmethyltransferase family protein [Candidatus Marinimicrobia bacterium]|jgi:protein-S-isoprenylcysteine O-methyltransferase Ste14|nr:isoprenylcysteine carboxylmethyltransferase family protein [Candidatus Neomarinimicrobiota bacterium]MBT3617360.1 isoprenylcysteine carboxylmethyltransferase family protein [Candidatus Neomarinimicrobiota bacterium]MBT3829300.1 isoprenylcysteine carboxylmethyltransferase family protein [Candidatus Neomarinimicrobiota bacterium]MBT3998258.1 isoprenylcysteine carboxylmethyltransferase family protein [Candidatus Neomarinimicrobiota bacterium]MBT4281559.1 isoprenylcysteine carboxylmethyltransfer
MDIRQFFFQYRSFTPIPIALTIIYFSQPKIEQIVPGVGMLLIGELIRIWAVSHAGGATRTRNVGAPFLCTSGPYNRVRNPLYIGNLMMFAGIVLIAGSPNILVMLGVTLTFFIVQYSLIVSLEEETLIDLFGDPYDIYRKNVHALFPRLTAWKDAEPRDPSPLGQTLITEKRTLQNVVLILLLIALRAYLS